jgi:hypothetical protein
MLEKSFTKVKIYLVIFLSNKNIKRVLVSLVTGVLKAIELAIIFLLNSINKATFS